MGDAVTFSLGANSDPFMRELRRLQLMVGDGEGRKIGTNLARSAGQGFQHGWGTVIREAVVIAREVAAGRGIGRIAASATILEQKAVQMGGALQIAIPIIIALGAAAYFTWKYFHDLTIAAKNLAELMNPLSRSFADLAVTMKDNSREAAAFNDWLKELHMSHENEARAIERKIQLMKKEAEARQELARAQGKSHEDLRKMNIQDLESQQAFLTLSILRIRREAELHEITAQEKEAALQGFKPGDLQSASSRAKEAAEVADATRKAMENSGPWKEIQKVREGIKSGEIQGTPQLLGDLTRMENIQKQIPRSVEVGGKKFNVSAGEAQWNAGALMSDEDRLVAEQKRLQDELAAAKKDATTDKSNLERVQGELDDVKEELSIKRGIGSDIAKAEDMKRLHGISGGISESQRIGAYAATPPDFHILLDDVKAIKHNTSRSEHPPVGTRHFSATPAPNRAPHN